MVYKLFFDGLFREMNGGNGAGSKAGLMCYGWVIYKYDVIIARGHGACANSSSATSIVAEYLALVAGLEALVDIGMEKDQAIEVVGDARGVIEQMEGVSGMKTPYMRPLFRRAQRLAASLPIEQWRWVSRHSNKAADKLTRRALLQITNDISSYQKAVLASSLPSDGPSKKRRMVNLMDLRTFLPAGAF